MNIFLKYTFKNMFEKKGRLALLVISIALSCLLFVSSLGVTETAVNTISNKYIERTESKELSIVSAEENPIFDYEKLNLDGIKDLIPEFYIRGKLASDDTVKIDIHGREGKFIDENMLLNKFDLDDFKSNECIISERAASEFNYEVGDNIKININNAEKEFKIKAINVCSGLFYDDSKKKIAIYIPYEYLNDEFNLEGKYNFIFASSEDGAIDEAVSQINDNNDSVTASALYDKTNIEMQISQLSTYFYLLLVIISIMSMIIIYSSYKLIVIERLKVIGTFLSQGATKRDIRKILCLESLLYGVLGGIIGSVGGTGVICLANYLLSPFREYGIYNIPKVKTGYIVGGIIFAIVLVLISSIVPIVSVSKKEVINIILSRESSEVKTKKTKLIVGIVLLATSINGRIINNDMILQMSPILLLILIISTILITPFLVEAVSKFLYKLLKNKTSVPALAINNVGSSKLLKSNITLMFISLFVVILINSAGRSMTDTITEAYENLNYDIRIDMDSSEYTNDINNIYSILEKNNDIDSNSIQKLSLTNIKIDDKSVFMVGVDTNKYLNYDNYIDWDESNAKKTFEKFKSSDENATIISEKTASFIDAKEGDTIKVNYKSEEKDLKVIGIVDGKMQYNSTFIMVKNEFNSENFKDIKYSTIVCNAKDSNFKYSDDFKKDIAYCGGSLTTYDESIKANVKSNAQIISILNIFTIIAVVIAAFGVLNNIMISFIQRKGSFAVLASLGLEKTQRIRMIAFESIYITFWAFVCSLLGQSLLLWYSSKVTEIAGLSLNIVFNYSVLPWLIFVTLIIVLIAIIPVAIKSRKFSVIESIRMN